VAAYLPAGKFVVAYAGSIGISNALDVFFECIERMRDYPDIHFVVLGDGDLRPAYEAGYGHLPNLTFAPRIPKRLVHDFLSRCDLLYFSVHQSAVWDYGLSLNKLIDYMLAAKPIVASYSGYPSMLDEAACGSFVPAGDVSALRTEILRVKALPPADRGTIGERGRTWLLAHRGYRVLAQDYLRILFPASDPSPVEEQPEQ
jgi:glycosyltransferase involved in cell wall biosynthesis